MSTLSTLGRALAAPPMHWTTALPLATAGAVLGLSLHLLGREPAGRGPEAQAQGLTGPAETADCDDRRARLEDELADLEAEVLALDAKTIALKAKNDELAGPLVPWPSELRAQVPAVEAEVQHIAAEAGGELVDADCAEYPCIFHLVFPADPGHEGWAAARPKLTRGGWAAEAELLLVVDPGLVLASPEDMESHVIVAMVPPEGPTRGPQLVRRLAHRRAALTDGVGGD
ncbi:MAG: hypothetical protein JNM72_23665 [Deltaproteobacteria bacterium]|nr:hypothetical protein [Deltaproteobacteria bacterium]